MKRTASDSRAVRNASVDLRYAQLFNRLARRFEDRVSDCLVDYEDEYEVVSAVVPRALHGLT